MIYKSDIGDFPLEDYPCEYWWVRYAVACTYLSQQFEEMWQPRIDELKKKYGFVSFSSRGIFNITRCRSTKAIKLFMEARIWIRTKDEEREVDRIEDKEIWETLSAYLSQSEAIGWGKCPYEDTKQSKCPFYKPSEFYKDTSLEELRKRRGYEL